MQNCEPLLWYGAVVVLLTGAAVIIPYWRGKVELISGWSFLMMGLAMFCGLASYEAATSPTRYRGLDWFHPDRSEVTWYMTAWTVFLVTLFIAYFYDPLPRRLAGRCLVKWPPLSTPSIFFVLIVCFVLSAPVLFPPLLRIVFVGPLLANVSQKAFIFATLFACVLWYRNPRNLAWLGIFIGIFLIMCIMSIMVSRGRRLVLTMFLVPVVVAYYYQLRYWRPTRSMTVIAVGLVAVFIVNLMYSSFRRFDRRPGAGERTATAIIEQVKGLGEKNWFERFAQDRLVHLSQQTAHYGLLTDRLVRTDMLEPRFLNTLQFIVVYPIPRAIWPDKPQALGNVIVKDTGVVRQTSTNWGVGVSGHAAYEGGLFAAIVFGYIAAFGTRYLDELLRRQPKNPFILSILAAASMHIVAWPRGDIFNMTVETGEAFFFAAGLGICARIMFGTERIAQTMQWTASRLPMGVRAPAP